MEFTLMLEIIGSLGFPIAACIALCWFIYKVYKASEKREGDLRKEIKESQEINAEAIKTLALYAERLDTIKADIEAIKGDIVNISQRIS